MILKFILLAMIFIYLDQALSNMDNEKLQRTKRSIVDEMKNATFKKVDVSFDGVHEIAQFSSFK